MFESARNMETNMKVRKIIKCYKNVGKVLLLLIIMS